MPTFREDLHLGHKVPTVDTADIVDGAITEPKLADDSVSTRTIQDGAVTEPKLADGAVSMRTLDNDVKTEIQKGAQRAWSPRGDYDAEAVYGVNDLVYDSETKSSYLSLRAGNMGHAVTDETWWMKVVDGSYVNIAIEEMEAAIAQAIEDAQEDISELISDSQATINAAVSGANTAAQTANTAAQSATAAKNTLVEEISQSLAVYETVADTLVTDPEAATGMLPVQNYVLGRAIVPMDNYIHGDVRTLAVGQNYSVDEAVKTTDGKMLRMTKEIKKLFLTNAIAVGDLKSYNGATYKALKAVAVYDNTTAYEEGDYALGRPAIVTITVDVSGFIQAGEISLVIGNVALDNITVTASSTAASIAADIVEAVGSIEGWIITDNNDGTITIKCDSAGANTLAFSFTDVNGTGVLVSAETAAGDTTISVYDGSSWRAATLEGMFDDESLFAQVDIDWLIANAATDNNVTKDILGASHTQSENLFDWDVSGDPTTNNTTYITPSKITYGARWTIKQAGGTTRRTGNILIPQLLLGKTYRIRFRYQSTISNIINVWVAKLDHKSVSNVTVTWMGALGSIQASSSGYFDVIYTSTSSLIEYLSFYTYQPAKNQYLDVTDVVITECKSVNDLSDKIDETAEGLSDWTDIMGGQTGYVPENLSSFTYSGETISPSLESANKFAGEAVMSLSNGHQGCACYGDYLFVGVKENPILYIYNLSNYSYVGVVSLGSSYPIANTHANTIGFSNQRYANNDEFPILYINSGFGIESDPSIFHVYGVRITRVGNVFSASIVKTIIVKNTGGWIEFMCADNKAWIKGQHDSDWGWYQIDMPALDDTEEIDLDNIAPAFTTSAITSTSQEHFFHNDKIYIIWGGRQGGYLSVLDTNTGTVVSVVDLKNLAPKEPEGFFIYKNHFYVLFMRELWKLYFNAPMQGLVLPSTLDFVENKFFGKRCAIVGDSISSYTGTSPSGYANYYPAGDVNSLSYIWWNIVCSTLGMSAVNCSWSGSRVTGAPKGSSASPACSDSRVSDIGREGNPDVIIFFIGCNDWGNEVSIGTWSVDSAIVDDSSYTPSQSVSTFREAFSLMLNKTQKTYPDAKIYCCTILDDAKRDYAAGYPSTNDNGVSTYTWNQSIKQIADAMGISVIDLHSCGLNYANIANYVVDEGLHPNKAGHALMAEKVISQLISE